MMILDFPYVSPFLMETLKKHQVPVLKNDSLLQLNDESELAVYSEEEFFRLYEKGTPLLSNSENTLSTVLRHVGETALGDWILSLKDKGQFRKRTADLYPDVVFREVSLAELEAIRLDELTFPCVLKPAVGFFSMGVYLIDDAAEWEQAVQDLKNELSMTAGIYPDHVFGRERFLIESRINGDEFAVDVYFDDDGRPVVLNILKHLFHGEKDTSDRVYFTGKRVVEEMLGKVTEEVGEIGKRFGLKRFPIHIEFRLRSDGKLVPIEANPLRFAGWCTTDIAGKAFDINPYEYFLFGKEPNWPAILEELNDDYVYMVVADTGDVNREEMVSVDYEGFLSTFKEPLELRRIDWRRYPVFAFVFARTNDFTEMTKQLEHNFKVFFQLKNEKNQMNV